MCGPDDEKKTSWLTRQSSQSGTLTYSHWPSFTIVLSGCCTEHTDTDTHRHTNTHTLSGCCIEHTDTDTHTHCLDAALNTQTLRIILPLLPTPNIIGMECSKRKIFVSILN